MIMRFITPTFLLATVAGVALLTLSGSGTSSAQSQSSVNLIAADALVSGNTATTVGPRDACVRTEVGSTVNVDFTVDAVPDDRPFIGFQTDVLYDQNLLSVSQYNTDFLLGAVGQYQPFTGLTDKTPDGDGRFTIGVADLAANAGGPGNNNETGPGVLFRLTLQGKAVGTSTVGPAFEGDRAYPSLVDEINNIIQVDNIGHILVAVGQDCPSDANPDDQTTPLPPLSEINPGQTPDPDDPSQFATPTPVGGVAEETPGPDSTAGPSDGTPGPDATEAAASATPTPAALPQAGDETNTGAMVLGIVLALAGLGLLGGGAWVLYRRRAVPTSGGGT